MRLVHHPDTHHAQGHVQVLLHPADKEVVSGLVVTIFPHLFLERGQQRLQLLLAMQARYFTCYMKNVGFEGGRASRFLLRLS